MRPCLCRRRGQPRLTIHRSADLRAGVARITGRETNCTLNTCTVAPGRGVGGPERRVMVVRPVEAGAATQQADSVPGVMG